MAAADGMANGRSGSGIASDMVGIQMGMAMGQQMVNQMNQSGVMNIGTQSQQAGAAQTGGNGTAPKFCPNCGTPTNGMKFCGNCGNRLY